MPRKSTAAPVIAPVIQAACDELGKVQAQLAPLKNRESELKEMLLAAGMPEIEGSLFRAKIVSATRWTVDVAAAKDALGKDWVAANSSVSTVRQVRVAPRADVAAAAVKLAA